jgi:hypothetical protein
MDKNVLLANADELLRTMPPRSAFEERKEETITWLGQAAAVIEGWNVAKAPAVLAARRRIERNDGWFIHRGYNEVKTLLHQARFELEMELGRSSVVVPQGQVFDYFDELRKKVETAQAEVFFVDAYLDADFVPRYLPYVANGVDIRLLGGPKKIPTLLPAVDMFAQQSGRKIQVRTSGAIHDRYLFVDRSACYQSGASFKDGAKNAPAALTQITDAFKAVWDVYEQLWLAGTVER